MTYHEPDRSENFKDHRPHAIVIGSGFGGLAAAVRLGARGYRVTIVERLSTIGGRALQFKQDGYTFDSGPTIVTAPFVFEELWALCGKRMEDHVKLKELSPFYAIRFHDGTVFNASSDSEEMAREIAKFEPRDVEGFRRFLVESEANFRVGFEQMVDKPFVTLWSMVKAMPNLILRRADRSVHTLVKKYIRNEKLQQALSFHPLFLGGNPLRTSGVMTLISFLEKTHGVHYAMGGTFALVEGLADLIRGQGGTILTDIDVDAIIQENGAARGIKTTAGEIIKADIVVSNADAGLTHGKLVPEPYRGKWTQKRIKRAKHSMSLFVWHFGTTKKFDDIEHHTIMMGPRYGPLLTDIFDRKILADDFSLYLYRPTATDSSMAPEGCDSFYVLSPVPNLDAKNIDWAEMAEPYRKKIEQFLEKSVMPGLSDSIATSRVTTPTYYRDALKSANGAGFSFEPTLFQLAWFRPHNRHDTLKDLYIVGAGTHPGAGLPGVISSAKILDHLVPHAETYADGKTAAL